MQSKTVFSFPATAFVPSSFLLYLRSVWTLSKKDFLCAPTKGAKGEMFFSTKKYFVTTTKLRHFSTYLSMVADGINHLLLDADVKREALMKRYRFVTRMKEMMREYDVAESMNLSSPIFELNHSEAISIEVFCDKVYGAMKNHTSTYDYDEYLKRFDANLDNLHHLYELAKTAHSDAELLISMVAEPSSMDSIYDVKDLFEGFMRGFFDVINTLGMSFPSISIQAQRCSNAVHGFDGFDFERYFNNYETNLELLDDMIDDILEGNYDSFNEASTLHLPLDNLVDTLGPVLVEQLTYLFRNVMPGYHFCISEDDEIEIRATD